MGACSVHEGGAAAGAAAATDPACEGVRVMVWAGVGLCSCVFAFGRMRHKYKCSLFTAYDNQEHETLVCNA